MHTTTHSANQDTAEDHKVLDHEKSEVRYGHNEVGTKEAN